MEQFYRGSAAALKSMYLLPMAIPAASVVVLWKILFDSHGFVNSAIHALLGMSGIGQILNVLSVQEVDWMNTDAAFGILVFSYVWKYLGYDIVLWMAGLSAIPQGFMRRQIWTEPENGKRFSISHFRISARWHLPLSFCRF